MGMNDLERTWDSWGRMDPMWAVLSEPEKQDGRWDPDQFFQTGRAEIAALMGHLAELGRPERHRRCLDFGCGVGRLTQALAEYFERADGVDIAASMVERARALNRHGDRCRYSVNVRNDLRLFPDATFDLLYSRLVLQHIPPDIASSYVPEFIRLLEPGGIAVFYIPVYDDSLTASTDGWSRPMADGAYRATIRIIDLPTSVAAGQPFDCRVVVGNVGDEVWPEDQFEWINLANHWRAPSGDLTVLDGQRAHVAALAPGEELEVILTVVAPTALGTTILEFDVVHEGVTWFADRGSPTTRRQVNVVDRTAAVTIGSRPPAWEMHSVPKATVVRLIETAGGTIVHLAEDGADLAYHEVGYFVTKSV